MLMFNPLELESVRFHIEEPVLKEIERRLAARQVQSRGVCKYFLKGGCNKSDCEFKHSRGTREKSVVCKHWLRGLCKKDEQCEFLHEFDMSRMPICHFWTTYGECSNPDCPFLHLKPEDRVKDCLWYYRGFCKHGPKCRNRHVRNEPCVDYMAGFCPKGPDCKFGHPKFDLPLDDSRGGSTTPAICTRCNSVGHKPQQCPMNQNQDNPHRPQDASAAQRHPARDLSEVTCYKCNTKGHYANACTGQRAFNPQHMAYNQQQGQQPPLRPPQQYQQQQQQAMPQQAQAPLQRSPQPQQYPPAAGASSEF